MDFITKVYQEHIWTFTRSTGSIIGQLEGLVLRASWKHADSYFQVWEPEVVDLTKVPHWNYPGIDPIFETDKGAPIMQIIPAGPAHCPEALVTREATIVDWVTTKKPTTFQVPKVIYYAERYGFTCQIITQLPGRSLNSVIKDMVGINSQGYFNNPALDSALGVKVRQF